MTRAAKVGPDIQNLAGVDGQPGRSAAVSTTAPQDKTHTCEKMTYVGLTASDFVCFLFATISKSKYRLVSVEGALRAKW